MQRRCASTLEPEVSCRPCPEPPVGRATPEAILSRAALTGHAGSAVPYRPPRTSARHTRDATGRRGPPDSGFRRVQRHRNDSLLRHMQRERGRAKHGAANKRRPDDSQLFHKILPSLQYGSQFTLMWNNASNIEHQAEFNLANLDLHQRWIVGRAVFARQI